MLNVDPRWLQRESARLATDVWFELLSALYVAKREFDALEHEAVATDVADLTATFEAKATRHLDALVTRVEPRDYNPLMPVQPTPINGHAHAALKISSPENGHPPVPTPVEIGPAASDEKAAADGGHVAEEPAMNQANQGVAADLVTQVEALLTWVRSQGIVSQDRDRAERQLYTIRSEARDPRMQASAQMKFDAVLKLLKGQM